MCATQGAARMASTSLGAAADTATWTMRSWRGSCAFSACRRAAAQLDAIHLPAQETATRYRYSLRGLTLAALCDLSNGCRREAAAASATSARSWCRLTRRFSKPRLGRCSALVRLFVQSRGLASPTYERGSLPCSHCLLWFVYLSTDVVSQPASVFEWRHAADANFVAGRGGLNEEVGEALAVEDGARRGAVSRTEVVHQPSDAEHALHLIAAQLRMLRSLPAPLGEHCCTDV